MNDWQAIMPMLAPRWNAEQFFESAGDIPIPFLLIDNSPNSDSKTMSFPKNVTVELHPDNLGTSISWNLGLMQGAKWTLILSCSTRFGEGGLTRYIEEASHWANDFGYYSPIGGHCHAVGRAMIERVGIFSPWAYPAYIEDRDFGRKIDLSNINSDGSMPVFRPKGLHIVGSAIAVQSGAVKDERIAQREEWYFRRWGGKQNAEVFTAPYGNPNNPLWYEEDPVFLKEISSDVYECARRGMDWYEREFHPK